MGRNVFVSYKYHDDRVRQFKTNHRTTVRDYVNVLAKLIEGTGDYYYRGERDGEDLAHLHYKVVENILADKMFHTSITIVLISPGMFENVQEIEQWIPWEISYSLRNKVRSEGNSNMNAILAIVLPDWSGRYDYAMYKGKNRYFIKEKAFFKIIYRNMFNRVGATYYADDYGNMMYVPGYSYVALARWGDFCKSPDKYLNQSLKNRGEWGQFDIVKKISGRWIS